MGILKSTTAPFWSKWRGKNERCWKLGQYIFFLCVIIGKRHNFQREISGIAFGNVEKMLIMNLYSLLKKGIVDTSLLQQQLSHLRFNCYLSYIIFVTYYQDLVMLFIKNLLVPRPIRYSLVFFSIKYKKQLSSYLHYSFVL